MSGPDTEQSGAAAEKAGCPKCGTVAYEIPKQNGTYDFVVAEVTTVCSTDNGVYVHLEGL